MPGDRAREAGRKARGQARGTWRNARGLAGAFTFDKILPSGISGLIQEVMTVAAYTAGRGSPYQQVWSSTTWIILAIVASPFTLGYSLILAVPGAIGLAWGLLRLVPAVYRKFQEARGNRLRDRDVPLWQRD